MQSSTNGQLRNPLFPNPPERLSVNEFHQLQDLVSNAIAGRTQLFQSLFGWGNEGRNIWQECRYPISENLSAQFYRTIYDLDSIGRRVVELMPKETWQKSPSIVEDESAKNHTPFETAFDELGLSLNPQGQSWASQDEGSPFWAYLQRLDILSGIGQFGVMLLGLDDGRNLQDPADGIIPVLNNRPIFDSPPTPEEINEIKQMASNEGMVVNYDVWNGQKIEQKQRRHKLMHGFGSADAYIENHHRVASEQVRDYCIESATLVTNNGTRILAKNKDREALRCIVENYYKGGGAPPDGAFIMGTDTQYAWQSGLGMKMPEGTSLSGTDQQYFGVQFGPSEIFTPKPYKGKRRLLFLRCFDESLVQVVRYEWNIRNPRFGLPVMYRITLNDPRQPHSGVGLPLATVYVHWSRIHHFAKNLVVSEIFGTPEMRPVLKELLNIEKVKCGGAEGFWRACFIGLAFKTHPQLGGDVAIDKGRMDQMINEYYSELNRTLTLMGMDVDTIAPDVADPTPNININMEAIAVCKGVPLRCLKGAERGELASSQDDEDWNERKAEYQANTSTPRNIVPLTDRFIQLGVLPEPEGYGVKWPDMDALSKKDVAAIGLQKTQAIAAYVQGGCETLVPPQEFLSKVLGFTEEEAEAIVGAAQDNAQDTMTIPPQGELGHPATATPPPKPPMMGGGDDDSAGGGQQKQSGDDSDSTSNDDKLE